MKLLCAVSCAGRIPECYTHKVQSRKIGGEGEPRFALGHPRVLINLNGCVVMRRSGDVLQLLQVKPTTCWMFLLWFMISLLQTGCLDLHALVILNILASSGGSVRWDSSYYKG